ncbi:MAG: putative DNA binding domain-containing protein [Lachnospiraceae bacterium]|nr:putative DNA binding domain-containing protein [Lachnospiraceae bacterium]
MIFDPKKFDTYREGNRLEVKSAKGGLPKSLWETYSAFANSYGGMILLGVVEKEDRSFLTTGLKNADKLQKDFWDTIHNHKKVSINLLTDSDVEIYDVNGDVVMAVYVQRAEREDKPVHINDDLFRGTYRRSHEGDYHCTKSEVKAMLRDQTDDTSDMKVLEDFDLSDFNQETVQMYRNRHNSYNPEHVWRALPNDAYLEKIGAAKKAKGDKKIHPTAAGLLMFGEEYRILYEYPEYFLDYREMLDPTIRWTDRLHSSSGDWTGNLFDFYFRVYSKLVRDVKIPFKLEGITRVDDTPVHKALREALANCLVNTDFFVPRGVVIRKEQDEIIMENPGYVRLGKDQMLRGGISDPRNKALMKMFNLIGIGERAGSGVPDIFAVWEAQGWKQPVVEETFGVDRTTLTLPLVGEKNSAGKKQAIKASDKKQAIKASDKKQATKTRENKNRIQELLKKQGPCGSTEISNHLGLSPARTRVILKEMVEEGMLIASGGNRNRIYSVTDNP